MANKVNGPDEISLGDVVEHRFTDLKGTVMGRLEWSNGCTQFNVQPREINEGKPVEASWFDWQDLLLVESAAKDAYSPLRATGGTLPGRRMPSRR